MIRTKEQYQEAREKRKEYLKKLENPAPELNRKEREAVNMVLSHKIHLLEQELRLYELAAKPFQLNFFGRHMWYKLVNKIPVPAENMFEVEDLFGSNERIVKSDIYMGVSVSTVFLCMDHSWSFENTGPVLFETMIFGGEHDQYQQRYSTWEEAEKGHAEALLLVIRTPWLKKVKSLIGYWRRVTLRYLKYIKEGFSKMWKRIWASLKSTKTAQERPAQGK